MVSHQAGVQAVQAQRSMELVVASGAELMQKLEALGGEIPTVFMSGHTEDEFIRSGALRPHQRFMPKPFVPSDLLLQVRQLIESRSHSI